MFVRSSERPGVLYELVDEDGNVLREYTEADEPVDFNLEVEKARRERELELIKRAVKELQEREKTRNPAWSPKVRLDG